VAQQDFDRVAIAYEVVRIRETSRRN